MFPLLPVIYRAIFCQVEGADPARGGGPSARDYLASGIVHCEQLRVASPLPTPRSPLPLASLGRGESRHPLCASVSPFVRREKQCLPERAPGDGMGKNTYSWDSRGGMILPPQRAFGFTQRDEVAPGEGRSGTLLNVLQCTGHRCPPAPSV